MLQYLVCIYQSIYAAAHLFFIIITFIILLIMANVEQFKEVLHFLIDEIREDLSCRGAPSLTKDHLQQVYLPLAILCGYTHQALVLD